MHSEGQKERDKLCKTTIYPRTLKGALDLEERLQGGSAAKAYIAKCDVPSGSKLAMLPRRTELSPVGSTTT